jgi:hypothetical protein
METTDIVIPVKPERRNEQLRYALRSLKNIPHRNVYIAGYRPPWVTNVIYIPNPQAMSKYTNSGRNINKACKEKDLSDNFVLFNDDFYITKPIKQIPTYHRGKLLDVLNSWQMNGRYWRGMKHTYDLLVDMGIKDPLCYELHVPMVINKQKKLEMTKLKQSLTKQNIHSRTFYGNLYKLGGRKIQDVKIYKPNQEMPKGAFISSAPSSWEGQLKNYITNLFNEPCKYER